MPKTPIVDAIAAHKDWLARLEKSIQQCLEQNNLQPYAEIVDKLDCDFGYWLMGDNAVQILDSTTYQQITVVHEQMHRTARAAVSVVGSFDKVEIEKALEKIRAFSNLLIGQLEAFSNQPE